MKGLVLDTETTGLKDPQVIELAYLAIDNQLVIEKPIYCQLFKPNKDIEPMALKVHGIHPSKLEGKPNTAHIKTHAPDVFDDNIYIIGHNINYDIGAIKNSVGSHDFKVICTKRLASKVLPNQKSYSLVNLITALDPSTAEKHVKNAHSADADVLMTYELLCIIARRIEQNTGVKCNLNALHSISENIGYMPYNQYR